ncbi:PhzF family phenazine biosynthesis isomerase [Neobacillus massiliamazoniensis]|uniref:PhzF family phenazine biosynthesis protein n=1 Tax=Neobacillus massiliamazoniensis TaxID=1499688 RepID=A0A0U1NXN7_9BACI|nr:PhzF family phenazine biosynthesis isomerase [Neobacillus massiliamazoniensis]CRK82781.1 PhzF family phenazine biosynthesis protein [Neobacillus massiliamazoniensis]
MKSIDVHHYDVFSKEPNKGNPAGVVLNGDDLTETEMQEIAFKVGFNETAFVVKSDVADIRIRFFTPGHEMNLCGHGTMATVYALKTKGVLGDKTNFTIETKVGILPIKINSTTDSDILITMKQASPQFEEYKGSKEDLANSIGLQESDIRNDLPILYGSTGTWTLLIPIKQLNAFNKMKPKNKDFPTILKEMPKSSIHPFCLETNDSNADMYARHFSSPYSGTIEDPVTGTASGVMGAYYAKYIKNNIFDEPLNLIVEQGYEIQKDGRVMVRISKNSEFYDVDITGNAVHVKDFEVFLEDE